MGMTLWRRLSLIFSSINRTAPGLMSPAMTIFAFSASAIANGPTPANISQTRSPSCIRETSRCRSFARRAEKYAASRSIFSRMPYSVHSVAVTGTPASTRNPRVRYSPETGVSAKSTVWMEGRDVRRISAASVSSSCMMAIPPTRSCRGRGRAFACASHSHRSVARAGSVTGKSRNAPSRVGLSDVSRTLSLISCRRMGSPSLTGTRTHHCSRFT